MTTTDESPKPPETALSRADDQAASLLASGYTEVTEAGRLKVGQRVYHIGQRYPGASEGTAVVERIFSKSGGKDVELIARRDNPGSPDVSFGFWADYHTIPAVSF